MRVWAQCSCKFTSSPRFCPTIISLIFFGLYTDASIFRASVLQNETGWARDGKRHKGRSFSYGAIKVERDFAYPKHVVPMESTGFVFTHLLSDVFLIIHMLKSDKICDKLTWFTTAGIPKLVSSSAFSYLCLHDTRSNLQKTSRGYKLKWSLIDWHGK